MEKRNKGKSRSFDASSQSSGVRSNSSKPIGKSASGPREHSKEPADDHKPKKHSVLQMQ